MQRIITWIEDKLKNIELSPPKVDTLMFAHGEKHPFLGESYTLNLIHSKSRSKVQLAPPFLDLYISKEKDIIPYRALILERWYRKQLEQQVRQLIAKWQPIINVTVNECCIKKMKTRWGTCNINKKRIWFSLELAKKPLHCIEYVVVHEMVHLLERYHNKRFHAFMSQFLPEWRVYKKELNGILG